MTERAKPTQVVELGALLAANVTFDPKTEAPEKRESRLRREEAEAEHKRRTQEADDAHKRKIAFILHIFIMAIVAIAFLASVGIVFVADPKTGLPDKAT